MITRLASTSTPSYQLVTVILCTLTDATIAYCWLLLSMSTVLVNARPRWQALLPFTFYSFHCTVHCADSSTLLHTNSVLLLILIVWLVSYWVIAAPVLFQFIPAFIFAKTNKPWRLNSIAKYYKLQPRDVHVILPKTVHRDTLVENMGWTFCVIW